MFIIEVAIEEAAAITMSTSKKMVITIKVGSNVVTNSKGTLDEDAIINISNQIKTLRDLGHDVLLISSGAVAAGRSLYQFSKKTDTVAQRQVLASIGQVKLISFYKEVLDKLGILCSQVLVTKEDFKSRNHYLNMQNCLKDFYRITLFLLSMRMTLSLSRS